MGRDKALIEIDGLPMARRVAAAMRAAGIERVVAVGPADLASGLESVPDEHPGEGPLGGILRALEVAAPGSVLVAACDLPWLDAESVSALLDAAPCDVAVGRTGRIEPLFARWSPSCAATLQTLFDGGERAVHRALASLTVIEVGIRDEALINVNMPEDLPS
ncbi:MAG: putative molybdenum cofactor biosynthesis protein [Ilumatobacteraceae bacterium]|nr:putative molybdenum cofactor biosynthesis protein [Ilumatobacteraceae bacterium]